MRHFTPKINFLLSKLHHSPSLPFSTTVPTPPLPNVSDETVILTTHRALALPEIVGGILLLFYKDPTIIRYRTRWLLNYALVNKTWYHETMRILWSDVDADGKPLDEVMIKISPDRRQMYANLVKTATVETYSQETEPVVQPVLENVVFPQLHTLRLVLVFHNIDTEECIHTPNLNMPNIQTLHVDGSIGPTYLHPDQWDYLTDRITVCFTGYRLLHHMANHSLCISRSSFRGC